MILMGVRDMHILVVEDSSFNAFCLRRLLESNLQDVDVTHVSDSLQAIKALNNQPFDLAILDGDLNATDGLCFNGPTLADTIIQSHPMLPLIAWSDDASFQKAFVDVFQSHHRLINDASVWPKMVTPNRIINTFQTLFGAWGQALISVLHPNYYQPQ